eukprot:6185614-Pleurochrysis_carterae.AAC.1
MADTHKAFSPLSARRSRDSSVKGAGSPREPAGRHKAIREMRWCTHRPWTEMHCGESPCPLHSSEES